MSYMKAWLEWRAGKLSDGEVISRMHVDPFFKKWFEQKRMSLWQSRQREKKEVKAAHHDLEENE